MVQKTTKISTHVLKLLHDVNKGDNSQYEEEGVEDEEGQVEGVARSNGVASEGSTCGRFAASYAALHQIDSLLMAPMTKK